MPAPEYLQMMLIGYLITIAIETAVLVALLSRRHPMRVRVFAGVWLTACTYPVVWLVLPPLFEAEERWLYLLAAETFAPVAECAIFWLAFLRPLALRERIASVDEVWELPQQPPAGNRAPARDFAVITLANLCSFGFGEVLNAAGLWR
jgi:hypothetical protein